jgi:hypothetical protein
VLVRLSLIVSRLDSVKCMVLNINHVSKSLRESDLGYSLGCEVPLER